MLSFVEGLNRFVSQKLLNAGANVFWVDPYGFVTSQEAWENVDRLLATIGRRQRGFNPNMIDGRPGRTSSLAASRVPQYPWYWSAFVLLALGGVSVWILNKRVTSLDQLR